MAHNDVLDFLRKRSSANEPDDHEEQEPEDDGLQEVASELARAIRKGDTAGIADALSSAFDILSSREQPDDDDEA